MNGQLLLLKQPLAPWQGPLYTTITTTHILVISSFERNNSNGYSPSIKDPYWNAVQGRPVAAVRCCHEKQMLATKKN
ncbi:MAG: hypothetical protein ABI707_07190 [Ferruginibacter sp.]